MNILMFSRLFYPHIGGVEKHVEKLCLGLIKKGHKVTILTEQFDSKLKLHQTYHQIRIFRIPIPIKEQPKKWHIWQWIWKNKNLIKQSDLIHIHDVAFWLFPFKIIFPKKPAYITFHGYEGSQSPRLSAIMQRMIGERIAIKTICVGAFMKKWYRAKPNLVIYGATDQIKASKHHKPKTVIYLGRLATDTGIMTYLKSLNILKNQNNPLSLDVYGNGPLLKKAQKYVKTHRLKVHFHRWVVNANRHLPAFELAFVSRYLSILEAMMAQRPVFAVYNNQIKQDYLNSHPCSNNIIMADKPEILATKIKNYRQDSDKINQNYNWAKQQTWDKLVKQYLSLWQN